MFNRIVGIMIVCIFFLFTPLAYADVIFEPENGFYKEYASAMKVLDRSFVNDGKAGAVLVREDPRSGAVKTELQEGDSLFLAFSCLYEGAYWGYSFDLKGWVKIDELKLLYDYISFEEEHFNEFYEYTGDETELIEAASALMWTWPGSGVYTTNIKFSEEDLPLSFYQTYKDSEGREWGFVGYYQGHRNSWLCISDPMNKDLPAFNSEQALSSWTPDTPYEEISGSFSPVLIIILGLVLALTAGTAVLIKGLWHPKKQAEEQN